MIRRQVSNYTASSLVVNAVTVYNFQAARRSYGIVISDVYATSRTHQNTIEPLLEYVVMHAFEVNTTKTYLNAVIIKL
jgi:hypothetical protein